MATNQVSNPGTILGQSVNGHLEAIQLPDGRIAVCFDPKGDFGPSASGRTRIVATAGGTLKLPNGIGVSFTAFRK